MTTDDVGSPRRRCGTMDVHRRLLTDDEGYRTARSLVENQTRAFVRGGAALEGVARIPVVVHVVHSTPEQDVSDEQVRSQLDVLDRDYRAANPDVAQVPPPFAPLVADAGVEFALATTDPDGNPTTGITRTATTVASFGTDDAVKSAATGGADPWPADRYLNLWVCRLGGGLLGYAQFPGGPAATDGVVVLHSAFGTTGTAAAPFDLGRTTTHEVGHWLNLFHIWGDDGTGCGGTDEVADTPNQGGPNYGRPTFPSVSCDNAPDGDLFVNYMDYVDDAAMVMFTAGQVSRMQATLAGVRAALVQQAPVGPAGRWGHSVEEDAAGVTVFRRPGAGFEFPRARGRGALDLRPDGTWAELGPGAADVPTAPLPDDPARRGRWHVEDGRVVLESQDGRVRRAADPVGADGGAADRLELRDET